jgi:hypothetical protein
LGVEKRGDGCRDRCRKKKMEEKKKKRKRRRRSEEEEIEKKKREEEAVARRRLGSVRVDGGSGDCELWVCCEGLAAQRRS